jgi:hypothetical protein
MGQQSPFKKTQLLVVQAKMPWSKPLPSIPVLIGIPLVGIVRSPQNSVIIFL